MRFHPVLTLAALLLSTAGCQPKPEATFVRGDDGKSDAIYVKSSDQRVLAATAEALRRVGEFIAALHDPKPGQHGFTIKVKVTDGRAAEHMWLSNVAYVGGKFTGTFVDESIQVTGYRRGMTATRSADDITDWLYYDNDNMVGGFTARLLDEMAGVKNP